MSKKVFFKERIVFLTINSLLLIVTAFLLSALNVDTYAIVFILVINGSGIFAFHLYDYIRKKKYYDELEKNLIALDKKHFISDVIHEGDFLESKLVYDVIKETTKSMNDEIASLTIKSNEYREYIELWVHEIKTPIASSKLVIENNYSDVTKSIEEEIDKVENYIEQALYYTRSEALEKDYLIKELHLQDCIHNVIGRNANVLIERKIKIDRKNIDQVVYSDSKWIEFILHQIVSNAIKYMDKKNSTLTFSCEKQKDNVILHIHDNGVGMNQRDVSKAFEKGYTGENGRRFGKSTGIGLYLCKKLCKKLGLSMKIESRLREGTMVSILFPINKMMIMK